MIERAFIYIFRTCAILQKDFLGGVVESEGGPDPPTERGNQKWKAREQESLEHEHW